MSIDYFEDIKLHQKYRSNKEYHLSEKEIIDFAKEWDPQPLHTDPEFARNTKFGGLVASGSHLVALCAKLGHRTGSKVAGIAGLGWHEVQFVAPARPGDAFIVEYEVIGKRASKSDTNAGIIRFATRLLNQHNQPVLTFETSLLVEKRPAKGTPSS
jgi:acyl dehydratase